MSHSSPGVCGRSLALTSVSSIPYNALVNGSFRVAQRVSDAISGAFSFGEIDRWSARADGTPTAGTIEQSSTSPVGVSGYSLHLSDVSTGAGGTVFVRQRIESLDAAQLSHGPGVLQIKVWHDVGSAIDYEVAISKADAANNFSSVTPVASMTQSVANEEGVTLILIVPDFGNVSNGLEVTVKASSGAITTKNFHFAEAQLEPSCEASCFIARPFEQELVSCQRFAYVYKDLPVFTVLALGQCANTTTGQYTIFFPTTMRGNPVITISANADFRLSQANTVKVAQTSLTPFNNQPHEVSIIATIASGLVAGNASQWTTGTTAAVATFDAEL